MEHTGMMALGLILVVCLGGVLLLWGRIWMIVRAFQESAGWGIVVLFLSPISDIIFMARHGEAARKPFGLILGGFVLSLVAGLMLSGMNTPPPGELIPGASAWGNSAPASATPGKKARKPANDLERVAGMLEDAGIDPDNLRTFRGRTIAQMTEVLGKPSAEMKAGGEHTYIFYGCFEVVSRDGGRTVDEAHYMGR